MIILLTVAIAPSLALFSYFYLRDQFSQEPSKLLFQSFIYILLEKHDQGACHQVQQ